MKAPKRILIIDDDIELSELLSEFIRSEGFNVVSVFDGDDGLESLLEGSFDLVILDIMLPGQSGLEILKRIRLESLVPVLMLTARGDDTDRIVGLELGADDYVPKPATAREILARIKAILRRTDLSLHKQQQDKVAPLLAGDLRIDEAARTAHIKGVPLALTSTEFNFLVLLARHSGTVVSKETLSEKGLGRPLHRFDRSIDVHISRLRDKIAEKNDGNSLIMTVYRHGYQLIKDQR